MKKLLLLLLFSPLLSSAQNVGIGTTTPTARLEVKKAMKSIAKISTESFGDTTQLMFSNRNAIDQGTDVLITLAQEQGLYFSSASDLAGNTKDSLLTIGISNGHVGIGVRNPTVRLQIHDAQTTSAFISMTNATTGFGTSNGLSIGMNSSTANIYNMENSGILFGTNGTFRVEISAAGRVGIGVTNPDELLEVAGNILIGNSGELNRPSTNAANLVPIAYGNISSTGFIQAGTGNFTVNHSGTGFYQITITGEAYQFQQYITVVTPIGTIAPRIACTGSGGGALQVSIYDIAGVDTDSNFHFVVYKQ